MCVLSPHPVVNCDSLCVLCWEGRRVMVELGDKGPIRPIHLREAYRRVRLQQDILKRSSGGFGLKKIALFKQ